MLCFHGEANQKLERDARHTHPGTVNNFSRLCLKMWDRSEPVRRFTHATENANLERRFSKLCILVFRGGKKRDDKVLTRAGCLYAKGERRRPLSVARGAENAPKPAMSL